MLANAFSARTEDEVTHPNVLVRSQHKRTHCRLALAGTNEPTASCNGFGPDLLSYATLTEIRMLHRARRHDERTHQGDVQNTPRRVRVCPGRRSTRSILDVPCRDLEGSKAMRADGSQSRPRKTNPLEGAMHDRRPPHGRGTSTTVRPLIPSISGRNGRRTILNVPLPWRKTNPSRASRPTLVGDAVIGRAYDELRPVAECWFC